MKNGEWIYYGLLSDTIGVYTYENDIVIKNRYMVIIFVINFFIFLAERAGFEPAVELPPHTLSKRAP